MAPRPDRRPERTRRSLRSALIVLMTEKPYESITVEEIINSADVGRSTFYTHYRDKDALLMDNLAGLRSILEQPALAEPATRRRVVRFSLPLFRHVHDEQHLARALFGNAGGGGVLRQVEHLLADVVRGELADLFGADPPARVPEGAIVAYVVGAYLYLLSWWVSTEAPISPEQMDRIFQTLVTPGIRAATTPPNVPRSAAAPAPTRGQAFRL
jgi:AcrR family transcriptional regulator